MSLTRLRASMNPLGVRVSDNSFRWEATGLRHGVQVVEHTVQKHWIISIDEHHYSVKVKNVAYDTRKVAASGVIGFLMAVLVITGVSSYATLYPTFFPPPSIRYGTLIVLVTDDPMPSLQNLNLTISSFAVQNETGGWIPLPFLSGENASFDLLQLKNVTRDLVNATEMQPGNYTKIRMQIVSANATLADGDDGTTVIPLRVPSEHIDIHVRFEVKAGETTMVIIDITADEVHIVERGKSGKPANLLPQFKITVIPPKTPKD